MLVRAPDREHALVDGVLEPFNDVFLEYIPVHTITAQAFVQRILVHSISVLFEGCVNFVTCATVSAITSSVAYIFSKYSTTSQ